MKKTILLLSAGCMCIVDGFASVSGVQDGRTTAEQSITTYEDVGQVHCNWGWQGLCNCYFTSGVFNTRKAQAYDFNMETNDHDNYWCGFNTITYENPNK